MTIDEAIEHLKKYRHDHHSYPTDLMGKAEQLGIEGLEFYQKAKASSWTLPGFKLPSQTEE